MEQVPSIGRQVTYSRPQTGIEEAADVTAVITDVWDADNGRVKLTAFPPDCVPEPVDGIVAYDAEGLVDTWRWPERV